MQPRALATREALLVVAARIFASEGYHAASMRDIAKAADLTQGALYFHFASKQALATEIIGRQHRESIDAVTSILESDVSGLGGIVRLSSVLARQIGDSPIVSAGLRLSTESVAELASVSSRPYREWVAASRVLLERASARGELRDGLDLDAASELVVSAFSGMQYLTVALGGTEGLEHRLVRMWPILLGGFARDASHPAVQDPSEFMKQPSGAKAVSL